MAFLGVHIFVKTSPDNGLAGRSM